MVLAPGVVWRRLVAVLVLLNLANLVVIARIESAGRGGRIHHWFSFDQESNFPAWFSSLLLAAAALATLLAAADARRGRPFVRHWALLGVVFTYLSLDEAATIHERIGSLLRDRYDLSGPLYYAGIIPALALVAVVAPGYIRFVAHLEPTVRRMVVGAAALYVGGAAGVESLTGWWVDAHPGPRTIALEVVATIEENLEMLGVILFLAAVLLHLRQREARILMRFGD